MIINDINPTIKVNTENLTKSLISQQVKKNQNIGLIVGVLHQNDIKTFAYGYANKEDNIKISDDTVFALGSNTKTLIKSLILVLEDKKLINLDEKISDILPSHLKYADIDIQNITIRDLMLHTSGLPREPYDFATFKAMIKYFFTGENIYKHIDTPYMYQYLETVKVNKSKQNQASYSNIGMGLLAYTISYKMQKPLDEILQEYLLKPLKMSNTIISSSSKDIKDLAIGYVGEYPIFIKRNTPLENWSFSKMMVGTGGGYSTVLDLLKLTKAHLQLSNTPFDKIFQKSHQVYTKDKELSYTLGWQVKYIKRYDMNIHYKYGVVAGFSSYIGMNLKTKDAVVVLKNNFNWNDNIGHNILINLALAKN